MKKHSSAAEGLKVITGNHERRIGAFSAILGRKIRLVVLMLM